MLRKNHERAIRGAEPGIHAPSLSLSDRRGVADKTPIYGERDSHVDAGPRRRARRMPVLAHKWLRRGLRHPDRRRHAMALRTQQVIAEETNVTQVVDPLGGSYFVEALTTEYEKRIFDTLEEIDALGGTLKLIKEGWFQRHIADFAYETALRKQSGEKPVIGVNCFVDGTKDPEIHTHPYDQSTAERQIARTQRVRRERDPIKFQTLIDRLVAVAKDPAQNIMPVTIELVRAGATMGDIIETLKTVWGCYRETPVF